MEKYLEPIERFNRLGLDVFSFDWRGQGLSSRLLPNRRKGHVESYDDYIGDMHAFVEQVFSKRSSGRRLLAGHSMGGHISLRFLAEQSGFFDKAVLLSPMVDIHTAPFPRLPVKYFAGAAAIFGFEGAYASGGDGLVEHRFDGNSLTSDRKRFERGLELVEQNQDLAIGGVTFGWLRASLESIDALHEPGCPESIETSCLLFSASEDTVVSNSAQRRICKRIPDCRLVEVPGARHEILHEKDEIQQVFWDEFDRFLD
jgi:lysophospholipase